MPPEPQELAVNEWGAISYYPQWNTLELKWGQKTRSMTDDGFKQTLQIMAEQGLKVRPKYMIVDSTEFFHTLGEDTLAWRNEHIVPQYNDAGVEKFAFLVTGRTPGTVEKGAAPGPDGPAAFPTGWFETRERMHEWLTGGRGMNADEFPAPREGFVITHVLVVADPDRSREFYRSLLGGQVLLERDPVIMKVGNTWLTLVTGGGPTDDKPGVSLAAPADRGRTSGFLNVRVADIAKVYEEWSAKGAEFLTEPKDHGREIRAYLRDPDGHLIEVGQATGILG